MIDPRSVTSIVGKVMALLIVRAPRSMAWRRARVQPLPPEATRWQAQPPRRMPGSYLMAPMPCHRGQRRGSFTRSLKRPSQSRTDSLRVLDRPAPEANVFGNNGRSCGLI